MTADAAARHARRAAEAAAHMRSLAAQAGGAPVALAKTTSNLFRDRRAEPRRRVDLQAFREVIAVDPAQGWVDTEAMITYEALVDATLAHGLMPAVVPELKTITAGGAVAGVGIEASSFRQGLVHDTLLEAELLLPDGQLLTCRPDDPATRELFLALPNSYGTLGYALRLRLRTLPVKPFVRVEHHRFTQAEAFFAAMARACDDAASDFVEGVAFGRGDLVLSVARFVDQAPRSSDYTYLRQYHRSLRERPVDWLHVRDWLWRWDTDWFWCSRNFGADRTWVRALLGRKRLNSATYTRWMRWNSRWGFTRAFSRLSGWGHVESVIQDVDLPWREGEGFLDFLLDTIGIVPIWVCPIRAGDPALPFALYPLRSDTRSLNFGLWDVVRRREAHPEGHFLRALEAQVVSRGGIQSLYSDVRLSPAQFDQAYGMAQYRAIKQQVDPQGLLPGLYEKCVQGA